MDPAVFQIQFGHKKMMGQRIPVHRGDRRQDSDISGHQDNQQDKEEVRSKLLGHDPVQSENQWHLFSGGP